MAKITTVPDPLLRLKSKEVVLDKKTQELIEELKKTLTEKEGKIRGVGLAAVQIGVPKRIFLAYSPASHKFLVFINPEIIWSSKRMTNGFPGKNKYEGCLSLPGKWALIKRHQAVKVKYLSEAGQIQIRKFSAVLAVVIQHEYDHLEGILFIDRALEQKAKIYELVKDDEDKECLREIKI